MSKTLRSLTCPTLLIAAALLATAASLPTSAARAQTPQYTWRNVQIVGGGFIPGIVFNQAEPNLVYARTDIGGAYRLDPATNRWIPLLDSIGWDDWNLTGVISIATDPVNPDNVYVAAGTYTNDWTTQNGAILRSTDGGATWSAVSAQPSGLTGGGTVAVAATGGGKTWTASTGIPAGARVAADRVNPNKFYGFKSGIFYRSVDGGKTFTSTGAAGLPLGGPVRFKAVPGREGDIWLAGGSETDNAYGLWHSTDSGASFVKLANVEEADNVGFGKAATGQTYPALYAVAQVAGVRGIFRSIDAGQTWVRVNDDQHQWGRAGDTAITGDPRLYGRVYIGTNGRGIIYGDGQ